MTDTPKPGEYGVTGSNVRHSRTRVKTGPQVVGAPVVQLQDGTPIQPIVIQVPAAPLPREPSGPKGAARGPDLFAMGASILVAVMLSAGISVYVASKFLDEYSHKLDRIESRVDALDTKLRTYRNDLTRVQTKFEAQDDTTMPDRLQKLGRRTDTLETDVEDIEAELELLQQN